MVKWIELMLKNDLKTWQDQGYKANIKTHNDKSLYLQ